MSLTNYINDPTKFSPAVQATLTQWYNDFSGDDAWLLIQRNVDCDCARTDIDDAILREFLKDIALAYSAGLPDAAVAAMDSVLAARRRYFLLPGAKLVNENRDLVRVVRADHFLKYQMHPAGIAITKKIDTLAAEIGKGSFTGRDLAGSHMGRADYPVWVCPAQALPSTALACRDGLGLHHIDHGHLVSISYPCSVLDSDRSALRAPTTLDGAAAGADNWIFAKRPAPGGPEWGHAVDLGAGAARIEEAVHGDFTIDSTKASHITLKYLGQITKSPPQVDFANLRRAL